MYFQPHSGGSGGAPSKVDILGRPTLRTGQSAHAYLHSRCSCGTARNRRPSHKEGGGPTVTGSDRPGWLRAVRRPLPCQLIVCLQSGSDHSLPGRLRYLSRRDCWCRRLLRRHGLSGFFGALVMLRRRTALATAIPKASVAVARDTIVADAGERTDERPGPS